MAQGTLYGIISSNSKKLFIARARLTQVLGRIDKLLTVKTMAEGSTGFCPRHLFVSVGPSFFEYVI